MEIVLVFTILVWIVATMIAFFAVFSIVGLMKYIQKRTRASLYLSLNYIIYILGSIFLVFGYHDVLEQGEKTELYSITSGYFLGFVTFGSLMLYYFFAELTTITPKQKKITTILAVGVIIWIQRSWKRQLVEKN